MKKEKKRNRIRCGRSERLLKITAVTVSLLFAALMLYPMIFAVSSSMKDNSQIYKVPPKLLPGKANSLSVVLDYTGKEFQDEEELKNQMMQDNVLVMFGTNFKFAESVHYGNSCLWYKRRKNTVPFKSSSDETSNGMRLWDL